MAALVAGVFIWLYYRIPQAYAEDLAGRVRMFEAAGVAGEVTWDEGKGVYLFEHEGRGYGLRYVSAGAYGGDESCVWASLETKIDSKAAFSLRRKSTAERLLSVVGLAKCVPSGDPRFDDHFTIMSESPDFAARYFSRDERRQAARSLFGQGFGGISLKEGTLSLAWVAFRSGSSAGDGPLLRAGLEAMKSLAVLGA